MRTQTTQVQEYSIGELAKEFGITARALRFYEDKGLLKPARLSQTRVYSEADRARLRLILRGKRVGFTLDEIREMMDLQTLGVSGPARLGPTLRRFQERIEALKQQQADIEDSIAYLQDGCAWLEARLEMREPSDDIKRNAAAFEALAIATLGE